MLAPIFLTTALLYIGYTCYSLHTILCKVRPLGIPYFVIPFNPSAFAWVVLRPLTKVLFKALGLTHHRFALMTLDWQYHQRYDIYRLIGSDIFFTVSPWKAVLHVADPDTAVEILAGKGGNGELYPKPDAVVKLRGLFGGNLLTVEGAVWRAHRKVTGTVIGKSLSIVWEESLAQIRQILQYYDKQEAINTSYKDFRRATLGIITHAGFSKVMEWAPVTATTASRKHGEGSYQNCFNILFDTLMWTAIGPSWVLEMLPFKAAREAGRATTNFKSFMNEWFEEKRDKIELDNKTTPNHSSRADLMESLVRNSGLDKGSTLENPLLSKSEVIGNAFIFILAGHETTARTIANAIYFLATYPEYQVKVQKEIDSILGDSDLNQTSYNKHFEAFSSGWIAAIMYETLRLTPPVVAISREIGPTPRSFPRSGGQNPITLPPGIGLWVESFGLSHHPKYWTQPGKTEAESEISKFRPERWLPKSGGNTMFKPYNGSFLPFSIGTRGCIGKKFAQVEFTAVMIGLFREMSLEFDSYGGRRTFEEARRECLAAIQKFETNPTLGPSGEMPGLKWVSKKS